MVLRSIPEARMKVRSKQHWTVTASGGEPRFAVDDRYATAWTAPGSRTPWLEIDLGAVATLGRARSLLGPACADRL